MNVAHVSNSEIGDLLTRHARSLPRYVTRNETSHWWPSIALFGVIPSACAGSLLFAELSPATNIVGGLLAGVGILAGLLFQVLAWVGSRISAIADDTDAGRITDHEIALIRRLDDARANIAYAAFVSILFVLELGVVALLKSPPDWLNIVSAFLLFHLGMTLLLVLLRINSIGKDDRVAALTRHTRQS